MANLLKTVRPFKHPKTGVYWYRQPIPQRLRPFAKSGREEPRHEFKRSLHTKKPAEAKHRLPDAILTYLEYERTLEERKAKAESGVLASSPPHSSAPNGSAEPQSYEALRILAGDLGAELLDKYSGGPPPAEAFANRHSIPPGTKWGNPSEPWTYLRYRLELDRRAPVTNAASLDVVCNPAKAFLERRAITLTVEDWRQFCELARDAIDAALENLQRHYRGDRTAAPLRERFPVANTPASSPKVSITGLVDVWAKSRERVRPETRDKYAAKLRQFSTHLGHDDALAANCDHLYGWRDRLKGEGRDAKYIEVDTIGVVRTIFRAAVGARVLASNPFAEYVPMKRDKTRAKARHPYSDDQTVRVLQAARKETGALRWLPWILAYTGARVREIADLHKADVGEKRGIPFFKITEEGEGKSVKTRDSIRDVPLHRALIKEGFLKFVEAAPAGPLFCDLPASKKYGTRGLAASERYMDWLRDVVGIADRKIVAYSWRHRMEDELREIDAPDEVAFAITGRTRQGSRAGYGHGPSLNKKAEWVEKLPTIKVPEPLTKGRT
jgi:integrase